MLITLSIIMNPAVNMCKLVLNVSLPCEKRSYHLTCPIVRKSKQCLFHYLLSVRKGLFEYFATVVKTTAT